MDVEVKKMHLAEKNRNEEEICRQTEVLHVKLRAYQA